MSKNEVVQELDATQAGLTANGATESLEVETFADGTFGALKSGTAFTFNGTKKATVRIKADNETAYNEYGVAEDVLDVLLHAPVTVVTIAATDKKWNRVIDLMKRVHAYNKSMDNFRAVRNELTKHVSEWAKEPFYDQAEVDKVAARMQHVSDAWNEAQRLKKIRDSK